MGYAQGPGVPNDYAYYVASTDNILLPRFIVALVGSSEQRTCIDMYEEKYVIVRSK